MSIKVKSYSDLSDLEKLSLVDFSYSRIDTYNMCPAKYFYSYIAKEPRQFSPAAVLGNIVHEVLENVLDNDTELDIQDLKREYSDAIPKWDPLNQISKELLNAGDVILDDFYDQHAGSSFSIFAKEMGFEVIIGSYVIRGFIDRIDMIGNRINIIDYKAQPLDSKILTPSGWKEMGQLKVGEEVISSDGNPTQIFGIYPQGKIPAYEITFTDNSRTVCSESHLWNVIDTEGVTHVLSVAEMIENGIKIDGKYKYTIPTVLPVHFTQAKTLPIDPYILGLILCNGQIVDDAIQFDFLDTEVLQRVKRSLPDHLELKRDEIHGYKIISASKGNEYIQALYNLGLEQVCVEGAFIPEIYLTAAFEDRYSLLQGLMDINGNTSIETFFTTLSSTLCKDIIELIRSLGGLPIWFSYSSREFSKRTAQREFVEKYIINVRTEINPFFLSWKKQQFRKIKKQYHRRILSIKRIQDTEMQCIKVMNPNGLYITDDYIVTHNTGKWEVTNKDIKNNLQLGIYALAMSQLFPDKEIHAELYYLRSGKRKGYVFTSEDLEEVKNRLVHIMKNIIEDQNFVPTPNTRICSFCDHAKSGACGTGVYRNKNNTKWGSS